MLTLAGNPLHAQMQPYFLPLLECGNPLQYSCLETLHGQRGLAGYSLWGCKESDTTEWLSTQHRVCEKRSSEL